MQLIINRYKFGQWLRRLPQKLGGQLQLSIEGGDGRVDMGNAGSFGDEGFRGETYPGEGDAETFSFRNEEEYKENLYKGILWMKEKYEQYRDLADQRYDRLKEHLTRMEKKYEELLESVRNADASLPAGLGPEIVDTVGLAEVREEVPPDVRVGVRSGAGDQPREFGGEAEVVVERAEAEFSAEGAESGVAAERAELESGVAAASRVRIQELEEQLARTQQRFDEEVGRMRYQLEEEVARGRRLQDEKNAGVEGIRLLEQQVLHSSRQLEEKQRMIADLEGQQSTDRIKIDELVTKLKNNSVLLMNIYQELDKSLHLTDSPPQA